KLTLGNRIRQHSVNAQRSESPRQSRKSAHNRRPASLNGKRRKTIPSSTLKIAVTEPIPRPSANTAAMVNPGERRRFLVPYLISRNRLSMNAQASIEPGGAKKVTGL